MTRFYSVSDDGEVIPAFNDDNTEILVPLTDDSHSIADRRQKIHASILDLIQGYIEILGNTHKGIVCALDRGNETDFNILFAVQKDVIPLVEQLIMLERIIPDRWVD